MYFNIFKLIAAHEVNYTQKLYFITWGDLHRTLNKENYYNFTRIPSLCVVLKHKDILEGLRNWQSNWIIPISIRPTFGRLRCFQDSKFTGKRNFKIGNPPPGTK